MRNLGDIMSIRRLFWILLAVALCGGPFEISSAQSSAQRSTQFNIVFDDNCDGMNLFLTDRGSAIGFHTGCNAGEFVVGSQFSSADESGVSVTFFEQASGLFVRYDIYRTGFRAGRFYVYIVRNNQLVRYSTYSPAP